jgi:hypothetical protein
MAFDVTIAGVNATSYTTLAEASTYFSERLNSTVWTAASSATQETALMHATRTLDYWVDWYGYRATEEQALRFPRYDVVDPDGYVFDSDIIPYWLKDATAELAIYFMEADRNAEPSTKGFKELQVGSLRLVVDKEDRDSITVLPDSVLAIIEPYGEIRQRGGSPFADLVRT